MNFDNDQGIIASVLTLDTTIAPPTGTTTNSLIILGTGALTLPSGNGTTNRPGTPTAAMVRFNTDTLLVEYHNGTAWSSLATGSTAVTTFSAGTTGFTPSTATSGAITLSGTLNVANGGTGASATPTNGQLLIGNGTSFVVASLSSGTGISTTVGSGTLQINNTGVTSVALSDASTTPIYTITNSPVTTTGTLTFTLKSQTANYVFAAPNGSAGQPAFRALVSADIPSLSSIYLPLAGGSMSSGANITMTGGGTVTGLPTPVNASDAANKSYVDAIASGLDVHDYVEYATTASNVYTATYANGTAGVGATLTNAGTQTAFSIDGGSPVVGDRVLIKNQATATQNGIYTVTTVGSGSTNWVLTRATDSDNHIAGQVHAGMFVFVATGSTLSATGWIESTVGTGTNEITVIGTDNITWTQFSGAGTYSATAPVLLTGSVFSLNGLSGYGTANYVIGVNAGGTALEYKQIAAGTGVSVTPTAGVLTIANTGVTSIVAGTAITVSGATGAVTVNNNGVTSVSSATGTTGLTLTTTNTGGAATTQVLAGTLVVANGGTGLTSTPTNGQIDIGNGSGFTRTTITQGTGVTVTNGAGSITIANSGLLSIANSTGTTGLTLTYTTTSGAVTDVLAGTLVPANGGTGATAVPTNGQLLIGNGTNYTVASLSAGTGISVTPGAGTLSIANTGVTSVALSAPGIFTVSGSPVTTTGTLSFSLNTQTTNLVFASPNGSTGAPTFRSLAYADLPIKLYVENPSSPTTPTATGTNSISLGSGSASSAANAVAMGPGSSGYLQGGFVQSAGDFATAGDAQHGTYVLRNITTNATATK